jgi:lysozyme family protein
MTDTELFFFNFILKWEGGYVNDPNDKGGETNMGITIATYNKAVARGIITNRGGIKNLTRDDAFKVFYNLYWLPNYADEIISLPVANCVAAFAWGSGSYGIKGIQKIAGVPQDGAMGTITVTALNDKIYRKGEVAVLNELYAWREQYFRNIVAADQTQAKYLIGWLRRLKGGDPVGRPGLIEFNEQFIGKKKID